MKTFLIIGASSGIGKNLAELLAQEGHRVFGTYKKQPTDSRIQGLSYHHLDAMQDSPDFAFLPDQIDGLAYCPGSINLKPFHRIPTDDFLNDFNLQVVGAVRVIQNNLARLKSGANASIVIFSTVAVQMGFNFHSQVSTSKGAIEGLTRALAAELAPGIRVNCIAPSLTDTPLAERMLNTDEKKKANAERHPLKRIGRTEDIAEMASFLLSDRSGWITGQVIPVDGGMSSLRV
jgi:NAD(P)-dependent dehydrogenase (short-subunit alcohol dehydrogenase family)